jgi:hypothetical protein
MKKEEREQKRAEFETTLTELTDEEKAAKLSEWDAQNPAQQEDDYRGKLNATNRFLEKEGYEFKDGNWVKKAAPAVPPVQKPEAASTLSVTDVLALRDVHEEDIETIQKFASFRQLSIAEARKDPMLASMLSVRGEERRTAEAAVTGAGGGRGATAPTGADLLAKAERTGELPETPEGMDALAAERFTRQFKKKKR